LKAQLVIWKFATLYRVVIIVVPIAEDANGRKEGVVYCFFSATDNNEALRYINK
jgi:hypothetical protein